VGFNVEEPMQCYRTQESKCPTCGHRIDAASCGEGRQPRAGDLSVCLYCGQPLEFGEDLQLKVLSEETLKTLPPELQAKIVAIRKYLPQVHAQVGRPSS
jgi:hypothetical protein